LSKIIKKKYQVLWRLVEAFKVNVGREYTDSKVIP
jgi:hypothetical protein